jgi:short-subunit dehydrogenase
MTPLETRPFAVVTGASSFGYELARQFATHGCDLLIAAEDVDIAAAARELRGQDGADVREVRVDLATNEGVDALASEIAGGGRPVNVLALNAGVGAGGAFVGDTDLADELRIVDLNVRSTVHLAKRLLPGMVERGQGRVLFTSSIASTMPGSFQAVYNASKSFVQSFALALREELKDSAVTITSLMPGPTDTEFFERADMLDTKVGADDKDDPAEVARQGFEALMAGKERVVSASLKTKLQRRASRVLPDRAKAAMHRKGARRRLVAQRRVPFVRGAVSAAVDRVARLHAVADDATAAVVARRRKGVYRTLEGVVGSETAAGRDHKARRPS